MQKKILQLRHTLPVGFAEVWKYKLTKHGIKIMLIVNGDIPKYALIAARGCRLIERVNHMLQMVSNLFGVSAKVIFTIVSTSEIIKIGKKLNGCDSAGKL